MTAKARLTQREILSALALIAFVAPTPLRAQDRTGPNAEPQPLPSFAEPPPSSLLPNVDSEPTAQTRIDATHIVGIEISAEGDGASAIPPPEWSPSAATGGRNLLEYRSGQPLDEQWVRSQFERQLGSDGMRASTAVALVQAINRAFLTAGFVNSGVLVSGAGDAAPGRLQLRLIYGRLVASEGAVEPVRVEWGSSGASGLSANYVQAQFPSARRQPLNALELERDFRLLSEDPRIRSVNAALVPGARPGEASLQLVVRPAERVDVYTGAANDRSPSVGGERIFIGGIVRNLLASGDTLSADGGLTRGVKDAQISYETPFMSPSYLLSLRAGFNNAAVIDQQLLPLDIEARDRNLEVGLSHRVMRRPLMTGSVLGEWSSSEALNAGLSLFYRKQRSFLLGEPFSFSPGAVNGRTEYKAARLIADYVRRNVDYVVALSVTGTVGLGGTQSDIASVPNPKDNFVAALAQLNVAKRIGAGLELRGRLTGQYSGGTLYSGERLSIGGAGSVRGYRESLYLVDRGIVGSVELAYSFSLSGRNGRAGADIGAFTASIFTDAAAFKNAAAPQPDRTTISSVGVSLAWTPSSALSAIASWGHALSDVELGGNRNLQDRGFHFRVMAHPLKLFTRP